MSKENIRLRISYLNRFVLNGGLLICCALTRLQAGWTACLSLVAAASPKDEEYTQALLRAVQQRQRRLFVAITWDLIDFYSLKVTESAKVIMDAGEELPLQLLGMLVKFLLLDMKGKDLQRRLAEEKVTTAGGAAMKAPIKGDKGKKAAEVPMPAKQTKLKRRGQEIDDEPDDGPQLYILLLGFYQPQLLSVLDSLGVHVSSIIRLSSKGNKRCVTLPSNAAMEVQNHKRQKQIDTFWANLQAGLNSGLPRSRLFDVAQLYYTLKDDVVPLDRQDHGAMLALGTGVFTGVASLLYDLLEKRKQHLYYLDKLRFIRVPSLASMEPQGTGLESLVQKAYTHPSVFQLLLSLHLFTFALPVHYYCALLESIPPEAQSVPLLLHCMLEQVLVWKPRAGLSGPQPMWEPRASFLSPQLQWKSRACVSGPQPLWEPRMISDIWTASAPLAEPLNWLEVERALLQFVFESMPLTETDQDGLLLQTRPPESGPSPWDDPISFSQGLGQDLIWDFFYQVLHDASHTYCCMDTFRRQLDRSLCIVCHNPVGPERQSREVWNTRLHTDVGFRCMAKMMQRTSTAITAWKIAQDKLKEEEPTNTVKKDKGKKTSLKVQDHSETSNGSKDTPLPSQQSLEELLKTPEPAVCSREGSEDIHLVEDEFIGFTGYSMNGTLVHVSGQIQSLFPADGGHIRVETVHFAEGSTFVQVSVTKDNHHFVTHIAEPRRSAQWSKKNTISGDNSECKQSVSKFGSFSTLLKSGIRLSFSHHGSSGKSPGHTPNLYFWGCMLWLCLHSSPPGSQTGLHSRPWPCLSPLALCCASSVKSHQVSTAFWAGHCGYSYSDTAHLWFTAAPGQVKGMLVRQHFPLGGSVSHSMEASRAISSQGTVVRCMRNGSTQVGLSRQLQRLTHKPVMYVCMYGTLHFLFYYHKRCIIALFLLSYLSCPFEFIYQFVALHNLLCISYLRQIVVTREDGVLIVVQSDGTIIAEHADGTRITTFYRDIEGLCGMNSSTATERRKEKLVMVECEGFATVVMSCDKTACSALFGDGTVIKATHRGEYQVVPSSGGFLHIHEDGSTVYTSHHSNNTALTSGGDNEKLQPGNYVMKHTSEVVCEVTDPEENHFKVRTCMTEDHWEGEEEGEEEEQQERNGKGAKMSRSSCVGLRGSSARFFVVHPDGSGTELLSLEDVEDCLDKAQADPKVAVLKEAMPEFPVTQTVLCWPILGFQSKLPDPPTGTCMSRDPSQSERQRSPLHPPLQACPELLEVRHIIQYQPVSNQLRQELERQLNLFYCISLLCITAFHMAHSAIFRFLPSFGQFLRAEEPVRRTLRTASVSALAGVAKAALRGFELLPTNIDFGMLRGGATYSVPVIMRNVGLDSCRFSVKQVPPSTGLRVTYQPGPVAAGMKTDLQVQLFAQEPQDPDKEAHLSHQIEILTETEILYLPVTANILQPFIIYVPNSILQYLYFDVKLQTSHKSDIFTKYTKIKMSLMPKQTYKK
uniref:Uncharacterized protein n=1 Tax=Paramormyrops kingsleyae TaxID=1676925 RepID=A0A3B3QX36_9TELE